MNIEENETKDLLSYERSLNDNFKKRGNYLKLVSRFMQGALAGIINPESSQGLEYYDRYSQEALSVARFAAWNLMRLEQAILNIEED